jgi:hypothetical protein
MTDFTEELRTLVDSRLGLPVKAVHFVERRVLTGGGHAALAAVALRPDEQVQFDVQDYAYPNHGLLQGPGDRSFMGMTVCIQTDGGVQYHVFIQSDNPQSPYASEAERELDMQIQQVVALVHELGHIRDMTKCLNFRFTPKPMVWLARAEAEAHSFALEYLGSRSPQLQSLLARSLFRLSAATAKHEQALYAALCSRVGKGRLKRWAAAA